MHPYTNCSLCSGGAGGDRFAVVVLEVFACGGGGGAGVRFAVVVLVAVFALRWWCWWRCSLCGGGVGGGVRFEKTSN